MSAIVKSVCVAAVLAVAPLIGAASAMSEDVAGDRAVEFKPLHIKLGCSVFDCPRRLRDRADREPHGRRRGVAEPHTQSVEDRVLEEVELVRPGG